MSILQTCSRFFILRDSFCQLASCGGNMVLCIVPESCVQGRQLRLFEKKSATLSTIAPDIEIPQSNHRARTVSVRNFSTKMKVEYHDRFETSNIKKPIHKYLRTCLPDEAIFGEDDDSNANSIERKKTRNNERTDSGFAVSFLGSGGGGINSARRIGAGTALRLGGTTFLFDACEGIQRQISFSRISMKDIRRIFVTHLHGDHVYGLPGLLLSLQIAGKGSLYSDGGKSLQQKPVIKVYGPPGLYNFLAMTLTLSCSSIHYANIVVYELVGGRNERGPHGRKQIHRSRRGSVGRQDNHASHKNIFLGNYPEISYANLARRSIPRNDDGTWTIEEPDDIAELLKRGVEDVSLSNEVNAGLLRKFHIRAAEVFHQPGVQTFGFTVEESTPPRKIDAAKATKLGVKPGPKYKLLKNGFPVMSDDESKEIKPEKVLADPVKPRKFAIIGDNSRISRPMEQLCQNADVLVHEATFLEDNDDKKAIKRGHSSASTAGKVARQVKAKTLVLNHLSAKLLPEEMDDIAQNAEESNSGVSQIAACFDFMELWVPRGGYDFESDTNDKVS